MTMYLVINVSGSNEKNPVVAVWNHVKPANLQANRMNAYHGKGTFIVKDYHVQEHKGD
jgi:hypothetical protein